MTNGETRKSLAPLCNDRRGGPLLDKKMSISPDLRLSIEDGRLFDGITQHEPGGVSWLRVNAWGGRWEGARLPLSVEESELSPR